MPLPLVLIGVAAGSALFGAKKGVDAVVATSKAKGARQEAQETFDRAKQSLEDAKKETTSSLEMLGRLKIHVWNTQLDRFVQLFEQLKNVELEGSVATGQLGEIKFSQQQLSEMKSFVRQAAELTGGGLAALGTGGLVGVASYGGAMTFASASTGTAISSLAGVAAKNATLAWFGGGSLASGGMGMAGGMMVLGGLVAGPALAVGGLVLDAKARGNLARAQVDLTQARQAAAQMYSVTSALKGIDRIALEYCRLIRSMETRMTRALDQFEAVIVVAGTNYATYPERHRRTVHTAVLFAQVMKILLETPLLKEDGSLDKSCYKALEKAEAFLSQDAADAA